jgi:osmotically-inducible protein OsmY
LDGIMTNQKFKRVFRCAGAVVAFLPLAIGPLVPAQNAPGGAGPNHAEAKTPDALTRAIRHRLSVLPYYSVFDHLDFGLSGRTVTLSGQVVRPTLKKHAENSIKSVEGVAMVVNNIEVLPLSDSDDDLRREIYRAIYEDTELEKYAAQDLPPIHIIVKNGTVALEGLVDSDEDRSLAGKRTASVVPATGLHNNLGVRSRDTAGN